MAVKPSRDPLVWIDCEVWLVFGGWSVQKLEQASQMTGLDIKTNSILQISCFITDYELNLLDTEGWGAIIHHERLFWTEWTSGAPARMPRQGSLVLQ